jgi:putative transposase
MMRCPQCESSERRARTELGYRRFRCRTCTRKFNEHTGARVNHLQDSTDVVSLVVLWRLRYTVMPKQRCAALLAVPPRSAVVS